MAVAIENERMQRATTAWRGPVKSPRRGSAVARQILASIIANQFLLCFAEDLRIRNNNARAHRVESRRAAVPVRGGAFQKKAGAKRPARMAASRQTDSHARDAMATALRRAPSTAMTPKKHFDAIETNPVLQRALAIGDLHRSRAQGDASAASTTPPVLADIVLQTGSGANVLDPLHGQMYAQLAAGGRNLANLERVFRESPLPKVLMRSMPSRCFALAQTDIFMFILACLFTTAAMGLSSRPRMQYEISSTRLSPNLQSARGVSVFVWQTYQLARRRGKSHARARAAPKIILNVVAFAAIRTLVAFFAFRCQFQ